MVVLELIGWIPLMAVSTVILKVASATVLMVCLVNRIWQGSLRLLEVALGRARERLLDNVGREPGRFM